MVKANLVVNDNVMKNVLSLTTRVASIYTVNPITYLVKIMVGLHAGFQVYNIQVYLTLVTTNTCKCTVHVQHAVFTFSKFKFCLY